MCVHGQVERVTCLALDVNVVFGQGAAKHAGEKLAVAVDGHGLFAVEKGWHGAHGLGALALLVIGVVGRLQRLPFNDGVHEGRRRCLRLGTTCMCS